MTDADLKEIERDIKRLKRVAAEFAAQMHDLVEERLPADYEEIPRIAQATYDACRAWAEASSRLVAASKFVADTADC